MIHEQKTDASKNHVSSSITSLGSDKTLSKDDLSKIESPVLEKSRTPGKKIHLISPMLKRKLFKDGSKKESFFGVKITDDQGVLEKLLKFKKNPR